MAQGQWMKQVKRVGRTCVRGDKLWLAFSGTGIGFEVTGRRCVICLHGDSTAVSAEKDAMPARYTVRVNGQRICTDVMTEADRTITVLDSAEETTAVVELIKLSESAMSTLAVSNVETDGTLRPLPQRRHLIEFVGDSITCGYGMDTTAAEQAFHTSNEDCTRAYAWLAADQLEADRSLVCLSGYGVLSGWTADPNVPSLHQLIPDYYEKCGFSYASSDGERAEDWAWDFSQREPDVVLINLGTNDSSYTLQDEEKQARFRKLYLDFLVRVRSLNPHAAILCVLGVMGDVLYDSICRTVADYTAQTGDGHISTLHLDAIDPEGEGYVSDFHPTPVTHARVAPVVADCIRQLLA